MDYFWSPNKAYGRRKEKKRKEKKRKREIKPRYGCLTLVWNYECLNGILKFYVKVHAIVWLGACPKPRVVRISS